MFGRFWKCGVQLLTPDRHGRIQDAVEKMGGGVTGSWQVE
jgi:hypothetical protein